MESRLRNIQKLSSSEAKEKIASDAAFRAELSTLSERFLRIKVQGCNTCFFDAFVKLLLIDEVMENCDFKLRSGALMRDMNKKVKNVTKFNLTNELAVYYLITNPHVKKFFEKIPPNINELMATFNTKTLKFEKPKEVKEEIKEEPKENTTKKQVRKPRKTTKK